ncbi:hypothetical protein GGI12_001421 [Dipsacomyces acuminosporus]|nr:hypothetical protein GGI12_001421 [Dipsacomyces acuminosporus]
MDEISLENLFGADGYGDRAFDTRGWTDNPVNLYISGCPDLYLFEVKATKVKQEEELLAKLYSAIYIEEWDDDVKEIETENSSLQLRALRRPGFDPVDLVRHTIRPPRGVDA